MMRGLWSYRSVGALLAIAAIPPLCLAVVEQGLEGLGRALIAVLVVGFWQGLFAVLRGHPLSPVGLVTVAAVLVLAPGPMAPWQMILTLSFAMVISEQIFGGWGRNFIAAPVAALAFVFFSFPEVVHEPPHALYGWATLPGALMLLAFGLISWRVLAGAVAALCAVTLLFGVDPGILVLQGGLVFGLVFLVADPVASASTQGGRWIYGGLAGGLTGLLGWAGAGIGSPQTIVFAALLASVFAPLIDYGVIATQSYLRSRRHG